MREAVPWTLWLSAASQLGVTPAAFWRLSLREWRALAAPFTYDALNRAGFAELAARYPDTLT